MHESCVPWPSVYMKNKCRNASCCVWQRTHFERLGDACWTVISRSDFVFSMFASRHSGSRDLPLLISLLWSQPCKADSQMPSWPMLKPNSWRPERTDIRVTFSGKKKVCIKREFYLLHMICDSDMIFSQWNAICRSPAHDLPVLFSHLTLQSAALWPDVISWPLVIWRKHVTACNRRGSLAVYIAIRNLHIGNLGKNTSLPKVMKPAGGSKLVSVFC